MSKWKHSEAEILISLYKQYPQLYDPKHELYYDREERLDALETITAKIRCVRVETTIAEVKQKIRWIRSQYTAEKTRIAKLMKTGTLLSDIKPLWCYEQLCFLDGYTTNKKPKQETSATASQQTQQDHMLFMDQSEDFSIDDDFIQADMLKIEEPILQHQTFIKLEPFQQSISSPIHIANEPIIESPHPTSLNVNTSTTCDADIINNIERISKESSKYDIAISKILEFVENDTRSEYDAFGLSIGLQLERLSEMHGVQAMQEIQQVLTKHRILNATNHTIEIPQVDSLPQAICKINKTIRSQRSQAYASSSSSSSNILDTAMHDANIL